MKSIDEKDFIVHEVPYFLFCFILKSKSNAFLFFEIKKKNERRNEKKKKEKKKRKTQLANLKRE
jgi:hypothetical protein